MLCISSALSTQASTSAPASSLEILPWSGVALQVPTKSEFFKLHPELHETEFLPFSASQLSEYPHPDSEQELPPTQFEVLSSQPSHDVLLDLQPLIPASYLSPKQTKASLRGLSKISQTTIPDSQEPFTQFTESIVEVPATAESVEQAATHSPKLGQQAALTDSHSSKQSGSLGNNTSSGTSIPSHQPDNNVVSFRPFSIPGAPDHQSVSPQSFYSLPLPSSPDTHTIARPASSRHTFQFLTQEQSDLGEFDPLGGSRSQSYTQSQPHEAQAGESANTLEPILDTILEPSQQPAQRVPPLTDHTFGFISQSQLESLSRSQDNDIVLNTSQRDSGHSDNCRVALPGN